MKNRTTPRIYDSARGLFEESVRDGDEIVRQTIEFDILIQNIQSVLTRDINAGIDMLKNLAVQRQVFFSENTSPKINKTTSYTNIHRLLAGVEFAGDRAVAPLLFASNTHDVQRLRRHYSDGLEGRFVGLIDGELNGLGDAQIIRDIPAKYEREVRGAIQEDTVAALLNSPQNGRFIVLPSSLEEDLYHGTDLYAYFIGEDGHGYKQGISVKTGLEDAEAEKRKYPHLVVLHAGHFNNFRLDTSRLLVMRSNGTPGLSESEEAELQYVTEKAYLECVEQIAAIPGQPLPHLSSQTVGKLRQFVA